MPSHRRKHSGFQQATDRALLPKYFVRSISAGLDRQASSQGGLRLRLLPRELRRMFDKTTRVTYVPAGRSGYLKKPNQSQRFQLSPQSKDPNWVVGSQSRSSGLWVNRPKEPKIGAKQPVSESVFFACIGSGFGGKSVLRQTTNFPVHAELYGPATGGLCCFWPSLLMKRGKARRGNRAAWLASVNLSVIRVEPNFE